MTREPGSLDAHAGDGRPDGWDPVCRAASAWLAERIDDLVGEICDHMALTVASYRERAHTDAGRAELEESVRGFVELFLPVLATRGGLSESDRARSEEVGAERAGQGFDLPAIQAAVHVAIDRGRAYLFTAARELVEDPRAPDAALVMERLLVDFHRDVRLAFEAGFRRRHDELRGDRHRAREAFVRRVLEGITHGVDVDVEVESLGLPQGPVTLVAWAPGNDVVGADFEARAAAWARRMPGERVGPLYFPVPFMHVVTLLWPLRASDGLEGAAGRAEELDLFAVAAGPTELRHAQGAYRTLRELVAVAVRVGAPGLYHGRDLWHLRLVTAAPVDEQLAFVRAVLGPALIDVHATERLCQLRAYYNSPGGTIKSAARAAGKAERTVSKTLDRVGDLTRYHPIRDRFVVELALCLCDHHIARLPALGDQWWSEGR